MTPIFRVIFFAFIVVAFAVGCAGSEAKNISGVYYRIDKIELEGVDRFGKKEFLSYLFMGETIKLPFTTKYYYNEAMLPLDIERIEALYKLYGYYDARVEDISITRKKRKYLNLRIRVSQGDPIVLNSVKITWPDGHPSSKKEKVKPSSFFEKEIHLKRGDNLEISTIEKAMDSVVLLLRENGFPWAQARAEVEVFDEEKKANIQIEVFPGSFAKIGKIEIKGLESVPEKKVLNEMDYVKGKPYSIKLIKQAEQNVYSMDVFSTVEVIEQNQPSSDESIDIELRMLETKMQSIKVGASVIFESTRWEEGISTTYTHRNLFGNLLRLDTRFRVGYAQLPSPFNMIDHGPVLKFEPRFTIKGLLEKRLVWTIAPSFELGLEEGYRFYTPGTHFGVSRLFAQKVAVELSHKFNFFDFFRISETLETNRTILGLDFRDPYFLSAVSLDTFVYLTDRIFEPRNGIILGTQFSIAGGPFGGQYDYFKFSPSIRSYWQIFSRLQLAFRAQTGFIWTYGDEPGSPFNMKYYLGGADTVRGWGQKRLSPKTTICPDDSTLNCRRIPIGGSTMVLGNFEIRFRTFKQLYLVSYLDMGDVRPEKNNINSDHWNYSVGGGLRLNTPVGKFRLDIAGRINDTLFSEGEPRVGFHLGLGEAF